MRWKGFFIELTLAISVLAIFLAMSPETTYAHESWFVEEGKHPGERFTPGLINMLLVLGGILFIVLALTIQRAKWFHRINVAVDRATHSLPKGIEWRIVAVLSGIMLIANAIAGVFLAPEMVLPNSGLVFLGRIGQIAIGLLLVTQLSFSLAGLLILVVAVPLATIYFQAGFLIDYGIEFIAIGLAFIFVGLSQNCPDKVARRVCRWMRQRPSNFAHLPLPIARIGLGLTFIALAIHYKLLNPNITLTFLDEYDLNFMRQLGFTGFTNLNFVFAAGIAEITFGLLLAAGIATRFVSAGLLMMLLTTLAIFGPVELIGHLPIVGIVLLLIYRGAGSYVLFPPKLGDVNYISAGQESSQSIALQSFKR